MIIGLTGEIASGKSTAAEILKENGCSVINVDQIGHQIQKKGLPAYNQIVEYFGEEILNEDSEIDRKKLGQIVFNDPLKLNKLNQITHKYIFDEVKSTIESIKNKGSNNIVIDAALLFKIGLQNFADQIWFIQGNMQDQIKRIIIRDNLTGDQAKERIYLQQRTINISEDKNKADIIIANDGSIDELKVKIIKILNNLK